MPSTHHRKHAHTSMLARKHAKHVRMQARKHASTQTRQAREHAGTQTRKAREHASTPSTRFSRLEHISYFFFSVSVVDFEQVNVY